MTLIALPGEDLVRAGLDDLARGAATVPALLVSVGAPRLRRLDMEVSAPIAWPEHRLYELLAHKDAGTAALSGWRPSTIDIDLKIVPEADDVLRAVPRLEETIPINAKPASPDLFIPVPPGPELYRFPAIDPAAFCRAVETTFAR